MTSIKVKFRPSSVADREGSVYYQVIHERKVRQILSGHKVMNHEWSERRSTVVPPVGCHESRRRQLHTVRDRIRLDIARLTRVIAGLDAERLSYSIDEVIARFQEYSREYSLFNFMEGLILAMRAAGKVRTAETYTATLHSFRRFCNGEDMAIDNLTADMAEAYEGWLRSKGLTLNSISFYMRILRATYNRAAERGIIDNLRPFRRVYTGVDKTVKRALPLPMVRKIKLLRLGHMPALDLARDMFMLSFYLRGMSFVDMAFLRKSDLSNGSVTYCRRKTGHRLNIAWTREMQMILDKYPENASDYLLPIIRHSGLNELCAYRNCSYNINHNLKRVAEMAGIEMPLTLYVARHSWASAAKAKGIPLSVISEGMGHDSELTTRIYLASLDTSVVDNANALIISSL